MEDNKKLKETNKINKKNPRERDDAYRGLSILVV